MCARQSASSLVLLGAGRRRPTAAAIPPTASCLASLLPWPIVAATAAQTRHATMIHRVRRPYQFTQMIQLSDGSTYTVRTTSPHAVHRTTKDSRNHLLWQPSEKSLLNFEEDEAGKLAAFRERYGRAFDMEGPALQTVPTPEAAAAASSRGRRSGGLGGPKHGAARGAARRYSGRSPDRLCRHGRHGDAREDGHDGQGAGQERQEKEVDTALVGRELQSRWGTGHEKLKLVRLPLYETASKIIKKDTRRAEV